MNNFYLQDEDDDRTGANLRKDNNQINCFQSTSNLSVIPISGFTAVDVRQRAVYPNNLIVEAIVNKNPPPVYSNYFK